jgi:hypothetical protein
MSRSEYAANVSLATMFAPASWTRPAPVRATRAAMIDKFIALSLGVAALSTMACIAIILSGAI